VSLVEKLAGAVDAENVLQGEDIGPRYVQDLWGSDRKGDARLVVRPRGTAEVAEVLRLCHAAGVPVVPQGGMTGLVSGGVPGADEVILSLERCDLIEEIDPVTRTMTVQAGVTLQRVQDLAEEHGLAFPLDLAPRGSCTIGGNLSTNAGGNRVLLYGMTRDLVLGVEAVLADGTVVNGLHKLVKNNAGYDLKHLFIGTEGTLGVITRATLRLRPRPTVRLAAFVGLPTLADTVRLLHRMQAALPGMISAFEAIWDEAYQVVAQSAAVRLPLRERHRLYALVECSGSDPDGDADRFVAALDGASALLGESAVAQTPAEVAQMWSVRERIPAEVLRMQPLFGFDVSLPVANLEHYLADVTTQLRAHWPAVRLIVFGHLGDGNVHIAVITGETTRERKPLVEQIVYRNAERFGGSISGEHGIGFEKRPYLGYSRNPDEIALMRRLKKALDPTAILNPGRVFTADDEPEQSPAPATERSGQ
jgi:FAD/FMN-containing dehydrogenase